MLSIHFRVFVLGLISLALNGLVLGHPFPGDQSNADGESYGTGIRDGMGYRDRVGYRDAVGYASWNRPWGWNDPSNVPGVIRKLLQQSYDLFVILKGWSNRQVDTWTSINDKDWSRRPYGDEYTYGGGNNEW